jgi:hypothetical protein
MKEPIRQALIIQLTPTFVVSAVGIGVACWLWRRHPSVSTFAVIALALRAVSAAAGLFVHPFLLGKIDQGLNPATVGFYLGLFNSLNSLVGGAAYALLVAAVFMDRSRVPTAT